jgi:hypothetical protein
MANLSYSDWKQLVDLAAAITKDAEHVRPGADVNVPSDQLISLRALIEMIEGTRREEPDAPGEEKYKGLSSQG